ncbi:vWA domain-containing protein [Amycolatopsis sp. lyj-23]|uniref:vWA domain-containing protein n=1 Tax=Amycolatopsis sp. lyj-23 TaxID=2789283 RepID=UPI00397B7FB8
MGSDVLPCYVACDVSLSMTDHIAELNTGLREFRGAVHGDASIAGRVFCSVVGFGERPRVVQSLLPMDDLAEVPGPGACAGTNFGPVFTFLRAEIDRDVRTLERHRLVVHRPLVFFLSDGQPTDPVTWPVAFAALTDPAWPFHPRVVTFGVGDADEESLDRIGTFRTFLGRDGIRVGTALIASVMHVLSTSRPPADRTLSKRGSARGLPWKRTEGDDGGPR